MSSISIRIISKDKPEEAAKALGQFKGTKIICEEEFDAIQIDSTDHGGGASEFFGGYVIIGVSGDD